MKLTVLGCSGSVPGPESPASGYLVEADGARIVVDLGSGAFGPLQRHIGLDGLVDLDAVVLSHLHPDHCADLCGLYVAMRYGLRATQKIPVYGPEDTAVQMARAYGRESQPGLAGVLTFHGYRGDLFEVGPFTIRVARVDHPIATYGIRIDHAGCSLVYSGDTGPTALLTELARGADLLLCEAAFDDDQDHPPGIHLTGRQAGHVAAAADVGQLVITHVPPWGNPQRAASNAADVFDGPVQLAATRASWEL